MNLVRVSRTPLSMIVAIFCLVGCGEKATTVSGVVSYNGEPVKDGSISFRPVDGRGQSFATVIVDGKYSAVDRATSGMKTVVIAGFKKIDVYSSSAESYKKAAENQKSGISHSDVGEGADYIAEDAEGNSKQVEILPGDQTMDFSITGAPRP